MSRKAEAVPARVRWSLVFLLALAAPPPPAAAALLGVVPGEADSQLVAIDTTTGAATPIGPTGFGSLRGLAADPTSEVLLASSGQLIPVDLGTIVRIDRNSGTSTLVGPPPEQANGPLLSLSFRHDGALFAVCVFFSLGEVGDSLCAVDTGTGVATLVNRLQYPLTNTLRGISGIAFDECGILYAATGSSYPGDPSLFTIEPGTGRATLVGTIHAAGGAPLAGGLEALELDHGILYGASADGRLVAIDPATAAYSEVGPFGAAWNVTGLAAVDDPPAATPTRTEPPKTATPPPGPCDQPSPQNPCIAGGGSQATDCGLEWVAAPVPALRGGMPVRRVVCYEGDRRCDLDLDLDNQSCTVGIDLCFNNTDPRLSCTPIDVATVEVLSPSPRRLRDAADGANLAALEAAAGVAGLGVTVVRRGQIVDSGRSTFARNLCQRGVPVAVPLRRIRGAQRPGRRLLGLRAVSSLQTRDADRIQVECRPSTCGNAIVEAHEECDDGNRAGGDGCDPGCRLGQAPTPTASASATATPTFTATPRLCGTLQPTPSPTASGPTPTPTETPTAGPPTNTPSATPTTSAVCGNGLFEFPETCVSCPGDCVVSPCTVTTPAPTITFRVDWSAPPGQPVSGIRVRLAYRSGLISLPGNGGAPAGRFRNRPSNSSINVNDLDVAAEVLVSKSGSLPEGRLFTAEFDRCNGGATPTIADLACTVLDCASSFGGVSGCTCEVTLP